MKIFLVRNAKSEKRIHWDGPASLLPLAPAGLQQSEALAEQLGERGVEQILSSPHLRCRQTLEPLARRLGLPITTDERLAERESVRGALELIGSFRGRSLVCCTHADLIPRILEKLRRGGTAIEDPLRSEKGSVWMLETRGRRVLRARYQAPPRAPSAWSPAPQRIGVLDLGSTSFHLLVADVSSAGLILPVVRDREALRLGAAIAGGAEIPAALVRRAVTTAHRLREIYERSGASRLHVVATAAFREAPNSRDLAQRLQHALRAPIRLLDGREEAHLIFSAIRRRIRSEHYPVLSADLGGGSLELALGDLETIAWETTLPLGVARLQRELGRNQAALGSRDVERIRERVALRLDTRLRRRVAAAQGTCIVSGGTARALGRFVEAERGFRRGRINGLVLSRAELHAASLALLDAGPEGARAVPGISASRAALLPTGALILSAMADRLELGRLTLCDWGLREGVLLEACAVAQRSRRRARARR